MVLAQGDFQTLARKHEKFDVYELLGAWIIDSQNKRGWIVEVVDGLETGSFVVKDGKIHRAGLHGTGRSSAVVEDSNEADLPMSTTQVILDAVAKWETEELDQLHLCRA